jgi:HEAT repeat protein
VKARSLALVAVIAAGAIAAFVLLRGGDDAAAPRGGADGGAAGVGTSGSRDRVPAPPVRRSVRAVRDAYTATTDVNARAQALVEAGQVGDAEAIAWLVEIAGSDDPLAHRAGHALGQVTNAASVETLAALAVSDQPVLVRANAVHALATTGTVAHAPMLAALVHDAAQPTRIRQESALAIARLGGDDAVAAALGEALAAADDEQLRISIIQGLGGLDAPAARAALEAHAQKETLSTDERAFLDRAMP